MIPLATLSFSLEEVSLPTNFFIASVVIDVSLQLMYESF
jgi:hypothetical protein